MEIKELKDVYKMPVVLNNKDLTTFVNLIITKLIELENSKADKTKPPVKK